MLTLLPPLSVLARRYVFAESIQFSVFAMAGPALIVLGAPWRLLRLSGPADRLAAARRRQTSFVRAGAFLVVFIAVTVAWRVPPVMDALASYPVLVVAETVFTATDPPLKFLSRFIPVLRLGSVALDLSFMVLFFVILLLINAVGLL